MTFLDWLKGRFSQRGQAMTLYKRGMASAKRHDDPAAVAAYTAVIDQDDAPAQIRAMALYNRSLVYASSHREVQAIRDLERLLDMPAAANHVKTEARRKLLRMQRTVERGHEQHSDES
jgi:hypothetical protein